MVSPQSVKQKQSMKTLEVWFKRNSNVLVSQLKSYMPAGKMVAWTYLISNTDLISLKFAHFLVLQHARMKESENSFTSKDALNAAMRNRSLVSQKHLLVLLTQQKQTQYFVERCNRQLYSKYLLLLLKRMIIMMIRYIGSMIYLSQTSLLRLNLPMKNILLMQIASFQR